MDTTRYVGRGGALRPIGFLVILLLLVGCGVAGWLWWKKGELARAIGTLEHRTGGARERVETIKTLAHWIDYEQVVTSADAPRVISALVHALSDPDKDVRHQAAESLWMIAEGSKTNLPSPGPALRGPFGKSLCSKAGALSALILDPDKDVRWRVRGILEEMGTTFAVGDLRKALANPDEGIREDAARYLAETPFPNSEELIPDLMPLVGSHAPRLRLIALSAIKSVERGQCRYADTLIPVLLNTVRDSDAEVVSEGSSLLSSYMQCANRGIVDALLHALDDPDAHIRARVAECLGGIQYEDRIIPFLEKATKDRDADVREKARFSLEKLR